MESTETECIRCREVKLCHWGTDPYIAEIAPDEVEDRDTGWWCEDCWDLRAGDV